jgi:dienelactone hydrolase
MVTTYHSVFDQDVRIDSHDPRLGVLRGTLSVPERTWGAVLFAQGGGSSCECPYAHTIAESLLELGLATLTIDLYSTAEESAAEFNSRHRVDIELMTDRLCVATDWMNVAFSKCDFRFGYVGAGAGAAAVLKAASQRADVFAAVSCDGLPALAGKALTSVTAATLLIVGERDQAVTEWNRAAFERLIKAYHRELTIIPNAAHPLTGREAIAEASALISRWFVRYLGAATITATPRKPGRENSTIEKPVPLAIPRDLAPHANSPYSR